VLALVALISVVAVLAVFIWALKDVPWREIAAGSLKPVVVLESANGTPLVRQGPYQGPYASFDQFPPHLLQAVLSIEDRRFMDHLGIDLQGITRALLRNIQAGSVVQGGSTITQQLIKLQYLESDRTLKRKIQELVIAFWLEWKLGKQEILTRYLNSAYLGAGATGMPAAARIYFNKEIGELNLPEAAMLAGLLRAPSQWNRSAMLRELGSVRPWCSTPWLRTARSRPWKRRPQRQALRNFNQRRLRLAREAGLPTGSHRRRAKSPVPRLDPPLSAPR
jgi:membrane peptidoglycan carboxypeptidase